MEKNEMKRKQLRISSYIVIFLALFYFVKDLIEVFSGNSEFKNTFISSMGSSDMLDVAVTVVIVAEVIITLIYIFIGYKGIAFANGKKTGGFAFILAVILSVIDIVSFINSFMKFMNGSMGYEALTDTLPMTIMIVGFVIEYMMVKKLEKNN